MVVAKCISVDSRRLLFHLRSELMILSGTQQAQYNPWSCSLNLEGKEE